MIQRKQTIFLLIAFILTVVCLCLPIGRWQSVGMGMDTVMYNLWITDLKTGVLDFSVAPLFGVLLITCPINLLTVFLYKNRILQSRLCMVNIVLIAIWYASYITYGLVLPHPHATFRFSFTACIPLFVGIFYIMAHRGILTDERLVQAANRIR